MRLGRSGDGVYRRAVAGEHAPHGVAMHVQLARDGAHAPVLDRVQAQDLRDQVRGYGHGAAAGQRRHVGRGAGSPGAAIGLNGCAAAAAPRRVVDRRRARCRRDRSAMAGDVVCACHQWSSGHPAGQPWCVTLCVDACTGMRVPGARRWRQRRDRAACCEAPAARALVALAVSRRASVARLTPARPAAIRLPRSQWLHKRTWARQRAHRNRRAGRSIRTPAQPKCWTDSSQRATLLRHRLHRHGVGRGAVVKLPGKRDRCRAHLLRHRLAVVLPPTVTPSRPAWPPCRAARQTPPSSITCSARNTASRCRMNASDQIRVLAIT